MEAFGRAVGAMFDESLAIAPTQVVDEPTEQIFSSLFMDLMDGEFLTAYKKREAAKLPRSMSCLSSVVGRMEDDPFTIDELARGMAMCGMDEGEAYLQVLDAIENEYIQPANGSNPLILHKERAGEDSFGSLDEELIELTPSETDYSDMSEEGVDAVEPVDEVEDIQAPPDISTPDGSAELITDHELPKPPDEDEDLVPPPVADEPKGSKKEGAVPKPPAPLRDDDFSDYDDLKPPDPE